MSVCYRRVDGLLAAEVGDDVLLFDVTRGTYFATGGVGAVLWEALAQPCDLDELCSLVLERYEVEHAECMADVSEFLKRLKEAGLVVEVSKNRLTHNHP
jgi:hypothetical protein